MTKGKETGANSAGGCDETDGTKLLDLNRRVDAALDERKSTGSLTPKMDGSIVDARADQSRCQLSCCPDVAQNHTPRRLPI